MKKILLFQSGNIGDVVITQPLAAILKRLIPHCHLTLIGQEYVQDVVNVSPQFDDFVSIASLLTQQQCAADAILFVHDHQALAIAAWANQINIPLRIGCDTHSQPLLPYYNKVLHFKYAHRDIHHALFHLQLLEGLNLPHLYTLDEIRPLVGFEWAMNSTIPDMDPNKFNLIIHPGTHGHTRDWPVEYFRELVDRLTPSAFHIYLTGSPAEAERFGHAFASGNHISNVMGQFSLNQFLYFISCADGLVANATGPLHVAAASNIHTLGLYPPRKSLKPEVWGPLGLRAETIVHKPLLPCFSCTEKRPRGCRCMLKITPTMVATRVQAWLTQGPPANR
jgi:heptosyltransferase-3